MKTINMSFDEYVRDLKREKQAGFDECLTYKNSRDKLMLKLRDEHFKKTKTGYSYASKCDERFMHDLRALLKDVMVKVEVRL